MTVRLQHTDESRREAGASFTEYVLLLTGIVLIVAAGAGLVGSKIGDLVSTVVAAIAAT